MSWDLKIQIQRHRFGQSVNFHQNLTFFFNQNLDFVLGQPCPVYLVPEFQLEAKGTCTPGRISHAFFQYETVPFELSHPAEADASAAQNPKNFTAPMLSFVQSQCPTDNSGTSGASSVFSQSMTAMANYASLAQNVVCCALNSTCATDDLVKNCTDAHHNNETADFRCDYLCNCTQLEASMHRSGFLPTNETVDTDKPSDTLQFENYTETYCNQPQPPHAPPIDRCSLPNDHDSSGAPFVRNQVYPMQTLTNEIFFVMNAHGQSSFYSTPNNVVSPANAMYMSYTTESLSSKLNQTS